MADEQRDPLAGVPAVEHSELLPEYGELVRQANAGSAVAVFVLENRCSEGRELTEHIAWERQQLAALRARVERLRAVVARASEQAVRFGGLSVVQFAAITSNALEPGDLEG